ncbi:hypothetical protein ACEWY4_023009 [Coilia grayii]|uniref:AIG1-type G domain-containing protein n=1 Tax=Coilia grayii TaxID=363190 RepID=A0ABD1J4Z0_9TELE
MISLCVTLLTCLCCCHFLCVHVRTLTFMTVIATPLPDQCWRQKELRIVLLGWNPLEKSLVGNGILGHEAFNTERDIEMCVRRLAIGTSGAQLTVVNTPQSWLHYAVQDPAFLEHRMAAEASMCQPGPHVLLLVIPVGSLPRRERTLEAALILLSDILWKHTMVVFTGPEKLAESVIKTIAKEYECLQSTLERCGHRYHCLNTSQQPQDSDAEVQELLKNIMAMAEGNQSQTGEHVLCTDSMMKEAERRIMLDNERAKVRLLEVQKRCQTHKLLQTGSPSQIAALKAVMVGAKQAGKSTVGNIILGQEVFQSGHPTHCCVEQKGEVVGKNITLVDTPGWHRTCCSTVALEEAAQQITRCTDFGDAEPDAFLVVIRCDEAFTETDRRLLQEHVNLWGRDVWRRSIVLFTWGDRLGEAAIEQHIERWPALVWLVEKCGNRYHVLDNVARTCSCKVKELVEKIEEVSLINDSSLLLKMLLQAQRDKKKQRSKVKELQKKVRDLQRDYEQLEMLQEERNQSLQDTLRSCEEREGLTREKEHLFEQRLTESEMEKKKHQEELDQLTQRCHKQDRLIDQMKREQMTLREAMVYQEKEQRDPKLCQSDQNNTLESVSSVMKGELLEGVSQSQIPSKDLHPKRQREVKTLSLSKTKRGAENDKTDIRAEGMCREESMHLTEPTFVYVELDCAVPQKVEPPTQAVTQQHPQQQGIRPVARDNWFVGAAIGAVIGSLKGLRRGPRSAVVGTAVGVTLGALLHIIYFRTKGKH